MVRMFRGQYSVARISSEVAGAGIEANVPVSCFLQVCLCWPGSGVSRFLAQGAEMMYGSPAYLNSLLPEAADQLSRLAYTHSMPFYSGGV